MTPVKIVAHPPGNVNETGQPPRHAAALGCAKWPDVRALSTGQVVRLEGPWVEAVSANGHTVTLTLPGSAPHRFRLRLRSSAHARPPSVEARAILPPVTAMIIATRATLLEIAASKAFLDVRASDETVTFGEQRFPNPLRPYTTLLDERIFGTLSIIHGNLNLLNISQGWKDG